MEYYTLQGDIVDYDYSNFGIYDNFKDLLRTAQKVVNDYKNDDIKRYMREDKFTGLVFYAHELNNCLGQDDLKGEIDIDKDGNLYANLMDGTIIKLEE